jgi:hypothetical protein
MISFGLDASTRTAGFAIVEDGNILEIGWIDLSKKETTRDKISLVVEFIKNNKHFDKIENIILESALSGFAGGFTSQQVLMALARFNGILEYVLEETFTTKKIKLIGAMTARKKIFGMARKKGIKSKVFVRTQLDLRFDLSLFLKKNKLGNEDKKNEDALDALVLALGH